MVEDFSATTYASPVRDESQDVLIGSGSGYNAATGVSSYAWSRELVTVDSDADRAITPGKRQTVIWALNRNAGAGPSETRGR